MKKKCLNNASNPTSLPHVSHLWTALLYYNFYRLILMILLFSSTALEQVSFGRLDPFLFNMTNSLYGILALISLSLFYLKKPSFQSQVVLQIFIDIFAITLFMFTSGGPSSGLGILLITVIVAGGLLTPGKIAYLYAAMATIAILSEQLYTYLNLGVQQVNFPNSGILGITLFASSFTMSMLSKRLSNTEALTKQQSEKLANLEALNTLVIKKMQSGVIILNHLSQIILINQAALTLLTLKKQKPLILLNKFSKKLTDYYQYFLNNTALSYHPILTLPNHNQLKLSFLKIGDPHENAVLIFLEDLSKQLKQAQALQLASLGRLTASIAHELRNPLSAISHAAQLLLETNNINPQNKRFADIIYNNTKRMNLIIKSVLTLSKEEKVQPKPLIITDFLKKFTQDFVNTHITRPKLSMHLENTNLKLLVDPAHLQQILINLFENGLYHSMQQTKKPLLTLTSQLNLKKNLYYIDVIDEGKGVPIDHQPYLFEPFFTTQQNGIGLGLYLAQQLSYYNNASITYTPTHSGKSRFRIIFPLNKDITL